MTPHTIWCPVVCSVAKSAAQSGFASVVGDLADGAQYMLKFLAAFWMNVPDPQVSGGSTAGQLALLTNAQQPVVLAFASLGFLAGLVQVIWSNRAAESAKNLVRGLMVMVTANALALGVTQLLLTSGDAYSTWILQQATGASNGQDAFSAIIMAILPSSASTGGGALGAWFILAILLILASMVQVVFMIVRGGIIYCLVVFLPYSSATAYSEDGWARFKRLAMLLFAFTIYKPVAATIYATGFKVLHSPTNPDQVLSSLMSGVYGLTILILAAIALPALIKFLLPVAAMGSSSAFSGGAALAALGTGAAMLAGGGAKGGAGAAAGGGAGLTQTGGSSGPISGGPADGSGAGPTAPGGGGGGSGAVPDAGGGGTGTAEAGASGSSSAGGGGAGAADSGAGGAAGAGAGGGSEQTAPMPTGAASDSAGGSGAAGSKAAQLVGAALQQVGSSADSAVGDGAERTSW
ncbi:hypothetical protein [Rudaeicoccus suwonensis]|nr:hypothetical protein [Rudaeicoccus suwonensis]